MLRYLLRILGSLLFFTPLQATWDVVLKDGSRGTLSVCEGDLKQEKIVYCEAYAASAGLVVQKKDGSRASISDIPSEEIANCKILTKEDFWCMLDDYFEKIERSDFEKNDPCALFMSLKNKDGVAIGYVSFDKKSKSDSDPAHVYIRELTVLPGCDNNGVGKILFFSFLNIWPEVRSIRAVTRKRSKMFNIAASWKFGAKSVNYVREGLASIWSEGFGMDFDSAFAEKMCGVYKSI